VLGTVLAICIVTKGYMPEIVVPGHLDRLANTFRNGSWFNTVWAPEVGVLHNPHQIQHVFKSHVSKFLFCGDSLIGTVASVLSVVMTSELSSMSRDVDHQSLEFASEHFKSRSANWTFTNDTSLSYVYAKTPSDIAKMFCDRDLSNGSYSHVMISSGMQMASEHVVSPSAINDVSAYEGRMRAAVECLLLQNITVLWSTIPEVGLSSGSKMSDPINVATRQLNDIIRSVCSSYGIGACIVLDFVEVARLRSLGSDGWYRPEFRPVFKYHVSVAFLQYLSLSVFGSSLRGKIPSAQSTITTIQSRFDAFAHGSWLGNIWIPRGGVFYNPRVIHDLCDKFLPSILFVGDSLGRRLASSLASVLEKRNTPFLSIDHTDITAHLKVKVHGTVRHNRPDGHLLDFVWAPTNRELRQYACSSDHSFHRYSHVVINVGVHDLGGRHNLSALKDPMKEAMHCIMTKVKKETIVLWKLVPFGFDGNSIFTDYNGMVRQACLNEQANDFNCVTFDVNTLLAHRSVGKLKIMTEDEPSSSHFGSDAHVAQIQYLISSLFGSSNNAPAHNSSW
jgi:hypothetical protein